MDNLIEKLKSNQLTIKVTINKDAPFVRASRGSCEAQCPLGKCKIRIEMKGLTLGEETISPTVCLEGRLNG